ncbi:DUF4365 domain-containing protein [Cupriavidus basilensis]|uniref:DUF4365 domain-containing protein n=1 Tax=Cupriavidus basilensis TaxID=68895 RepID=UPI0039F67728
MNAKEIGRAAGRIFAYRLPANWIFRSQEDQEDYGIDGEIEIASPDDKASGFIFKVQIKGQQNVSYVDQGNFVAFNLPVARLRYYLQQVETPVILAVVDVTEEKVFWKSLQDDTEVSDNLKRAIANGQNSMVVHLPTSATLPAGAMVLLAAVEKNINWLRLHALNRLAGPIDALLDRSHDDVLDQLLNQQKQLSLKIYNEKFERLYAGEEFHTLSGLAHEVIRSATELVETRISAGVYLERLMLREVDRTSAQGFKALGALYAYMLDVVRRRRAPAHIRRYVLMLFRAQHLQGAVHSDYHYFLSAKQFPRESLTGWIVASSRLQTGERAARHVLKTVQMINRAVLAGQHSLLLDGLPRFAAAVSLFAYRLAEDGLTQRADDLLTWLKFCIDLALDVAKATKDVDALAQLILLNAWSECQESRRRQRIEESIGLVALIDDAEMAERLRTALNSLTDDVASRLGQRPPDDEIAYFRRRALGLGIDVDNPEDKVARIIHQGLLDYNPERVVKDCESLVMVPGRALGVPAQLVGLPSAGTKLLHCLKKGHTAGGWRLDEIYSSPIPGAGFRDSFCEGCESRRARGPDWRWSSQWQHELAVKHKALFAQLATF